MPGTFIINRLDLKRTLLSLGISDSSIETMLSTLNKQHRHVNAVVFVGMLQKLGVKSKNINNILRRMGIDDTTITEIFNTLDEEKIQSTFGKVVELLVE